MIIAVLFCLFSLFERTLDEATRNIEPGFGADGEQIVPKGTGRKASAKSRWTEVVNASVKVTKLIDLCGE